MILPQITDAVLMLNAADAELAKAMTALNLHPHYHDWPGIRDRMNQLGRERVNILKAVERIKNSHYKLQAIIPIVEVASIEKVESTENIPMSLRVK